MLGALMDLAEYHNAINGDKGVEVDLRCFQGIRLTEMSVQIYRFSND
jgi:hypothetical protein